MKRASRRPFQPDSLEADRREALSLGQDLLEATIAQVFDTGQRRCFSGVSPAELERLFDEPLPETGRSPAAIVRRLRSDVFAHSMQMSHPRVFGLFSPAPLPVAALAELPAAFLNQSLDVWKAAPAGTHVELRLIRWITGRIGFGAGAFGVLTSGGGLANLIGLKMARDRALRACRRRGVGAAGARLRVYASDQTHFSVERALDLLGLGSRALVRVPADSRLKLSPERLEAVLRRDRGRGLEPMAVVATAGTTSTGTIDPLAAIGRVARHAGAHYHVDAAYGGALLFSNRERGLLNGIERADSVTIDPHKWLFQPFSLAGLFVPNRRRLESSFRIEPGYLHKSLDPEPQRLDFYHYSPEGSRPFRGLKLWLTLQRLGRAGLAARVERTLDVARYLERAVAAEPRFEACDAPVELASVCFRYLPRWARRQASQARSAAGRRRLNAAQTAIQQAIERGGFAWFPTIVLRDTVYFRFGVFNPRTSERDVDKVLAHVLRTAARLGLERDLGGGRMRDR
jgi:glutamate/tyrosine decarboxylase-like PLP-dependent enzyme